MHLKTALSPISLKELNELCFVPFTNFNAGPLREGTSFCGFLEHVGSMEIDGASLILSDGKNVHLTPSFLESSRHCNIMAEKDIYEEFLGRHTTEAQRMDDQFRIISW